jgi:hypothetical protein
MRFRTVLGAAGLVVVVAWSAAGAVAQESSSQHPADIRVGSCAGLGEVIVPLAPLVIPEGDPQGHDGATPVQQSVTEVPLLLENILSASHSVAVHASAEQGGTPIACGEIGGTLADDGSLSVGLQAMNGAKLSGVAAFASTPVGDGTEVTVLLVDERGGRERADEVVDGADDVVTGGSDAVDGVGDVVDGTDDVGDGGNAADGVGNVTVMPAPDRGRDADGTDTMNPTDSPGGQPGDDGAVDRPGRDSDGGRGQDGDRDHGRKRTDGGAARAGEDGTSH